MQSIASQTLLGGKAFQRTIHEQSRNIVKRRRVRQRQPNRYDHAASSRNNLAQDFPGRFLNRSREKRVA